MNEALKRYNDLRFHYLHDLSVLRQNLVYNKWDEMLDEEEDRISSASIGRESHNPRWFLKSLESMTRDMQNRITSLREVAAEMDRVLNDLPTEEENRREFEAQMAQAMKQMQEADKE